MYVCTHICIYMYVYVHVFSRDSRHSADPLFSIAPGMYVVVGLSADRLWHCESCRALAGGGLNDIVVFWGHVVAIWERRWGYNQVLEHHVALRRFPHARRFSHFVSGYASNPRETPLSSPHAFEPALPLVLPIRMSNSQTLDVG